MDFSLLRPCMVGLALERQEEFLRHLEPGQNNTIKEERTRSLFIVYTIALLLVLLTQGRSDDEHWCIASPGTPDWLLQSNLDYACGFVDCDQQCFLINPTSLFDRTSLAMDLYYKRFGNTDPINCYFKGSGLLVAENPGTHFCTFAGGARGVLVRWIVAWSSHFVLPCLELW
ncbi:hypothetical protein F2Q68_00013117 [Brassica cretica]|uniref:X8 domain-containing protein n=1 Tax=Brassica cretica TaxID=69181 RepID=A0A8S9HJB9_BRACR|nr:hypothetical protein F2Q68_00013117 [Brassica cretica]